MKLILVVVSSAVGQPSLIKLIIRARRKVSSLSSSNWEKLNNVDHESLPHKTYLASTLLSANRSDIITQVEPYPFQEDAEKLMETKHC